MMAAGAALAVWLFFSFAEKRVGAAIALGLSLLLLFFGSAWEGNFIESGITYAWCLAAGLGALLALERGDRRGDLIACALLGLSIASVTFGLAFALASTVILASRPRGRRALWVVAVPLALYAAWFVWLHVGFDGNDSQRVDLFNLVRVPAFFAGEASATAGALTGLNYNFSGTDLGAEVFVTSSEFGPILAVALVLALALRLRRGRVTPMMWTLLAALAITWLALTLGYVGLGGPSTVRYTYIGGALIALIGVEAARGVNASPFVKLAVIAACLLAIAGNVARLRDASTFYRGFSTGLRAQLTAIELARDSVDPAYGPSGGPGYFDGIVAGDYLAAVDRVGTTGFDQDAIGSLDEITRATLDETLVAALRIAPSAAQKPTATSGCERDQPVDGVVVQEAAPSGAVVSSSAPAQLAIRRYADTISQPLGDLDPAGGSAIALPPDRSFQRWTLVVSGASAPVTICPA